MQIRLEVILLTFGNAAAGGACCAVSDSLPYDERTLDVSRACTAGLRRFSDECGLCRFK